MSESDNNSGNELLPFYPLLYIFSHLDTKTFKSIKLLNKQFSRIYLNKCNEEDSERYGNVSSEMYRLRLDALISKGLLDFRPVEMSNQLYHKICSRHMSFYPFDKNYFDLLCKKNKLFELQMLEVFLRLPTTNNLNEACKNGNLEIIKYFAPTILPNSLGATSAEINHHNDIVEFLKKYNIYPAVYGGNTAVGWNNLMTGGANNIAIGSNALVGLTTGSRNIALGYNVLFGYN